MSPPCHTHIRPGRGLHLGFSITPTPKSSHQIHWVPSPRAPLYLSFPPAPSATSFGPAMLLTASRPHRHLQSPCRVELPRGLILPSRLPCFGVPSAAFCFPNTSSPCPPRRGRSRCSSTWPASAPQGQNQPTQQSAPPPKPSPVEVHCPCRGIPTWLHLGGCDGARVILPGVMVTVVHSRF